MFDGRFVGFADARNLVPAQQESTQRSRQPGAACEVIMRPRLLTGGIDWGAFLALTKPISGPANA